jgi:hypothetical protein
LVKDQTDRLDQQLEAAADLAALMVQLQHRAAQVLAELMAVVAEALVAPAIPEVMVRRELFVLFGVSLGLSHRQIPVIYDSIRSNCGAGWLAKSHRDGQEG